MREIVAELKALRLYRMAAAWVELGEQGAGVELGNSRWLLEHLLQAENADRAMRSVSHQMHAAKFPVHRDLAGFDFTVSPVDAKLIHQLATLEFTEQAHNVVLVGGCGTGKSHLGTAIGVSAIASHSKRVRFYFGGRSGPCAGAGEGPGQGRAHCCKPAAHGFGHPRRTGVSAVQPGWRGVAVSPAEQAL